KVKVTMAVQFRLAASGRICCCSFDASGKPIKPTSPCAKCKAHFENENAVIASGLETATQVGQALAADIREARLPTAPKPAAVTEATPRAAVKQIPSPSNDALRDAIRESRTRKW